MLYQENYKVLMSTEFCGGSATLNTKPVVITHCPTLGARYQLRRPQSIQLHSPAFGEGCEV